MKYYLVQSGREPVELEGDYKSCRKQVMYVANQELKRCRARYGCGRIHIDSKEAFTITIGKDRRSSLWTAVALLQSP